jgi:ribonuclease VapC
MKPTRPTLRHGCTRGARALHRRLRSGETTLAVARVLRVPISEAAVAVERFLSIAYMRVVAIDPAVRHVATEAYDGYGKSRHPAALNFGDCFAYACARHAGMPLLYKGDDFPLTDIETA